MSDTFTHTVPILAIYREECLARLEKLARRGARYGQAITWTETPRTVESRFVRPDGREIKRSVDFVDLTITGQAPRVGEFEFEASLERTSGGVIISAVPGINVGKLGREWDGRCDHCGSNRARTHGFVVRKGKVRKIVGRSCLRDFLGTDAPEKIAGRFSFLRELMGTDDEDGWYRGGSWADLTDSLIMAARVAINLFGWRKNDHESFGWATTLGYVGLMDGLRGDDHKNADKVKARDAMLAELSGNATRYQNEAQAIIDWARALKPRNDYQHNLKVALSGETVATKHRGLAVSACAAFDKQKEIEAERKEVEQRQAERAPSRWLSSAGERITIELEFARCITLPDNGYGARDLVKFFGPGDEVVSWISSSVPQAIRRLPQGGKIKAKFTVKRHAEFRDVKETHVSRLVMIGE